MCRNRHTKACRLLNLMLVLERLVKNKGASSSFANSVARLNFLRERENLNLVSEIYLNSDDSTLSIKSQSLEQSGKGTFTPE